MTVYLAHVSNQTGLLHGVLAKGGGQIGVMVFFALSGFLMGHLYLGERPDRRNVGRFLVRRLARVAPLFVAIVLASFVVNWALPDGRFWVYPVATVEDIARNLALIKGTDVMWSVVIEIQFYLAVPAIWFAYGRAPRMTMLALALIVAGIFAWQATHGWRQVEGSVFLTCLPYFLAGLMIARSGVRAAPAAADRRWNAVLLIALVAYVLIVPRVAGHWMPIRVNSWSNPLSLLTISLLLIATLRAPWADAVFGSRPFRFLGRVSYSIYLLHLLVTINIAHHTRLEHKPILFLVVTLPLVLILSQLSFVLIERPARAAINRRLIRKPPRIAEQAA